MQWRFSCRGCYIVIFVLAVVSGAAHAEDGMSPPAQSQAHTKSSQILNYADSMNGKVTLLKDTTLLLRIEDQLSSKTNQPGDRFRFSIAADVLADGQRVIPAGTQGFGEVIHSDNAGMGGKSGELILAARYIDLNGRHIPLRRFRFGVPEELSGEDRSATATGITLAGTIVPGVAVISLFMKGGEFEVPVGTLANALVKERVELLSVADDEGQSVTENSNP